MLLMLRDPWARLCIPPCRQSPDRMCLAWLCRAVSQLPLGCGCMWVLHGCGGPAGGGGGAGGCVQGDARAVLCWMHAEHVGEQRPARRQEGRQRCGHASGRAGGRGMPAFMPGCWPFIHVHCLDRCQRADNQHLRMRVQVASTAKLIRPRPGARARVAGRQGTTTTTTMVAEARLMRRSLMRHWTRSARSTT